MFNGALKRSYQEEWEYLFKSRYYLEQLRSLGIKSLLRNSHFRSVCWKVFLECLPEDTRLWKAATESQRRRYDELLDKFHINPRRRVENLDININNPLSQSHQSPWNQYFQDSELRVTIEQDVVRTFPEIEFFHSTEVQQMMISILFSYAREFPHISYKQGMHELLAPIIFILHSDQEAYLQASKVENLELDIRIILNQNYTEHDAFFLFCQLMEAVETWYITSDSPKFMSLASEPFVQNNPYGSVNTVGIKLNRIYDRLLKQHDVELFLYLEQLEISPQIYGIRWLRLLFGREFPIHDLLVIWDAIFADSISFGLVDYIFVAMLISMRDLLLRSDYTSCLNHLMHYPHVADVHHIIDLALYLRDPGSNIKPVGCSVQILNPPTSKGCKDIKSNSSKNNFSKSVLQSPANDASNKQTEIRPKTLRIASIGGLLSKEVSGTENTRGLESENVKKTSVCENTSVLNENEFSASDVHDEVISSFGNKSASYTFPRSSIRNVMGCKVNKTEVHDLVQSFGHTGKECASSGTSYQEMVPLMPSTASVTQAVGQNFFNSEHSSKKGHKSSMKDVIEQVRMLRDEITKLRTMNEYCVQQITHHIEKLQENMIGQSLLYEDEMFIALAGLKRARDILKGTVPFTEEVIDDDYFHSNGSSTQNKQHIGSSYKPVISVPAKGITSDDSELIASELSEMKIRHSSPLLECVKNKSSDQRNCDQHICVRNPEINKHDILTLEEMNVNSSSCSSDLNIHSRSKS